MWRDPKPIEDHQFWLYNAKDSAVTLEIWNVLKQDLYRQGNWLTYEYQRDVIKPLQYPIERGMRVNLTEMSQASEDKGDELIDLVKQFREHTAKYDMPDINPNAVQQCMEYFYIKLEIIYLPISQLNITNGMVLD